MYPMKLKPALKDYIWGGTRFKDEFHMKTDLDRVSEVWSLSAHKDGVSVVMNGEHKGKSFADVIAEEKTNLLGTHGDKYGEFPILVKLIDAADNLSVQVHPDDAYAMENENDFGKTEAWYVLEASDNAELVYGFKSDLSKEEFIECIENNTISSKLNYVPVKAGDLFFIEAGTIHAIGKGILLAEIQQNSNVTYRVYDYNRTGVDGKLRELHVDKAIDVTKTEKPHLAYGAKKPSVQTSNYTLTQLVDAKYFKTNHVAVHTFYEARATITSFVFLINVKGTCTVTSLNEKVNLKRGEGVFLPANSGHYSVAGWAEVLEVSI